MKKLIAFLNEEIVPMEQQQEVTTNIKKGAKDVQQRWKNAGHLVTKSYEVAGVEIPTSSDRDNWTIYLQMLELSVKELTKNRPDDTEWRLIIPLK